MEFIQPERDATRAMSANDETGVPGFTLEAAHARDQQKETVYPPMPPAETPDYAALRRRVLTATREARASLGDD